MILKRVYKVPNGVKKLLRSIFFGFPDFSDIHRQAHILSIEKYIEKNLISVDGNFEKI